MARNWPVDRIAVLMLVASSLAFTRPASVSGADGLDAADKLQGTWALTVGGTPFRINRTFFANGTNVDAATFPPIPPTTDPLILTDGHGAWKRIGPGKYAVTLLFFQNDPTTGALHSFGKVRETVRITNGVYEGVFETDWFLANGVHVFHLASTTQGHRIPVQPAP
jgi:hypothetical protein